MKNVGNRQAMLILISSNHIICCRFSPNRDARTACIWVTCNSPTLLYLESLPRQLSFDIITRAEIPPRQQPARQGPRQSDEGSKAPISQRAAAMMQLEQVGGRGGRRCCPIIPWWAHRWLLECKTHTHACTQVTKQQASATKPVPQGYAPQGIQRAAAIKAFEAKGVIVADGGGAWSATKGKREEVVQTDVVRMGLSFCRIFERRGGLGVVGVLNRLKMNG